MNRAEFLRELREVLAGEVSPSVIEENIRYYDQYIAGEAAAGRDEEEVIGELGGPRIIARTIIDSQEGESAGRREEETVYEPGQEERGFHRSFSINLGTWYGKLLALAAAVLVLAVVIFVITGLLYLMIPLFVIGLVIWLLRSLFRR